MKIITDLVFFCHSSGATDYEMHLAPNKDVTSFTIKARIENMDPDLLKMLNEALELPRSLEIEQNYWELGGDTEADNELILVGMMLDKSEASYENGILTITAERDGD